MSNPYSSLKDHCFWSRSMGAPWPSEIDPVTRSASIEPTDRISTIGSCFAQHLSRHIRRSGLTYYIAERTPVGLSSEEALRRSYGVYSARYGNVYTALQAVQLFDRAYGFFGPVDDLWVRGDRLVDAFRPQVEPEGFVTRAELEADRERHLAAVRSVFEKSDWLVFTLGLTEGWRSRQDGAMYPMAPGVAAGAFNPDHYAFVNFSAQEVEEHLSQFMDRLASVNPRCRVLFTVSPVPLIATYEDRHVLVSTTFSKAALRVAVDAIERRYDKAIYFPSYEIITSPATGGRYYENDLREVTDLGVTHVMRVFDKHFIQADSASNEMSLARHSAAEAVSENEGIVCDEEIIEQMLAVSRVA